MGHRFNPEHMDRLLSKDREKMISPERVWRELDVQSDSVVADIGAGPGFFSIPAARATAAQVYAVDIEPQMLDAVRERAVRLGLTNVTTVPGRAERIPLDDAAVDRTLCAFVLHEVEDLAAALGELRRITRPGGRVGLLEWEKKETSVGPPVTERLDKKDLLTAARSAGFSAAREWQPNPDQYMLMFQF